MVRRRSTVRFRNGAPAKRPGQKLTGQLSSYAMDGSCHRIGRNLGDRVGASGAPSISRIRSVAADMGMAGCYGAERSSRAAGRGESGLPRDASEDKPSHRVRGLRTDPEAKPRAVAAPRPTGPVDDDLGRVRVENRSISGQSRRVVAIQGAGSSVITGAHSGGIGGWEWKDN
jgi:hypothetical protein